MSRARLLTVGASVALVVAAVPAVASDPESGTVSASSPSVTWSGNATGYGVVPTNILITTAGQDPACPPQACDTFDLTVADSADLTVTAAQRAADNFTELHVVMPDGTVQYVQSAEAKPATIKVKKAPKGEYTIEVLTNEAAFQAGEYDASATLNVPKPAAPAPTTTTPPASPTPAPAAAEPAASLTLKTRKASAKKSRKGLKLSVAATKPVKDLVAQLTKGSKVLGKGKLAQLASTGTVKVKTKTLKPGTYVVALSAKDASTGQLVGLRTKFKVTK